MAYVMLNERNEYLESYDPDYQAPESERIRMGLPEWVVGLATWTTNPDKAMTFESMAEGMELWRKQSTVQPLRGDGKPNRPLSAHTVQIVTMKEAANEHESE